LALIKARPQIVLKRINLLAANISKYVVYPITATYKQLASYWQ